MTENRRIEITSIELETKKISVDFQFGDVLVNFDFRESDLPMLENLLLELRKEFADLKEMEKQKDG